MYKMQFKESYCDSLKSKAATDLGSGKLTGQKFLQKQECDS